MTAADQARAAARAIIETKAPLWLDPPLLQPAAIYLELSGEDIRRRAFLIDDHAHGELCLRPDMTVPAVRAAFALDALPTCIAYEGLVFRKQTPSSTREPEFLQIGAEWLGHGDMDADAEAEIIACALEACRAAGVAPVLKLGDRAIIQGFIAALGLEAAWAQRVARALSRHGGLDALRAEKPLEISEEGAALAEALAHAPEDHAETALEDVLALARITRIGDRPASEIVRRLRRRGQLWVSPGPSVEQYQLLDALVRIDSADGLAEAAKLAAARALNHPNHAQAALEKARARHDALLKLVKPVPELRFLPGLGRTVAYYDGLVFELEAPALGERASLGGGGRYDGLARALAPAGYADAENLRAAGFALRPARMAEACA